MNKKKQRNEQEIFNQELKIVKNVNPQLFDLFSNENQSGQSEKIQNVRKKLFMLNLEFAILRNDQPLVEVLKKHYLNAGNNFKKICLKCEKNLLTLRNPEKELNAQIHLSEIAIGQFNLTK
jgi:SMC interacting uncharacterized protein involved in chromosome segregation